jgi:hypothetical protein
MISELVSGESWESIVALARFIDRGVASRQGIDNEQVLRLARAVVGFQQRLENRPRVTAGAVDPMESTAPATETLVAVETQPSEAVAAEEQAATVRQPLE